MSQQKHTIAILGGSGAEGSGLGLRWAHAGHDIIIGSRDAGKALASADALSARLGEATGCGRVSGMILGDAAAACEIAVLTVPFAAQLATLTALRAPLQGKI